VRSMGLLTVDSSSRVSVKDHVNLLGIRSFEGTSSPLIYLFSGDYLISPQRFVMTQHLLSFALICSLRNNMQLRAS
jgi:hypothetical protein